MAQLVVRNLEAEVKQRLRRRALRNGQSMEEEVRAILRNAVKTETSSPARLGSRLRTLFSGIGFTDEVPEMRGQRVRASVFKK